MGVSCMQFVVNGEHCSINDPPPTTVGELITRLQSQGQILPGYIVSEILVDGQELVLESSSFESIQLTAQNSSKVDVTTESPKHLIKRMLEDGIHFCHITPNTFTNVAVKFRDGDHKEANQGFVEALDRLSVFLRFLQNLEQYAQLFLKVSLSQTGYDQTIESLNQVAEQAVDAQQNQDWVLLADILEFEVSELFDEFLDLFDQWWDLCGIGRELKVVKKQNFQ